MDKKRLVKRGNEIERVRRIDGRESSERRESKEKCCDAKREEFGNNSWLKRIRREVECCVWREEKKEESPREQRTECSFLNPRKNRVFLVEHKNIWCLCQENEQRVGKTCACSGTQKGGESACAKKGNG
jgi:hypothetical protein